MLDAEPSAPSTPYRTSDVLELTVALEEKNREIDRLRASKKRGKIGVIAALAIATVGVASFSAMLHVRYVPKEIPAQNCPTTPEPVTCSPPVVPDVLPVVPPPSDVTDTSEGARASLLEQLGGEPAVKPLATEITRALYADPVLARNGRIASISREKLEILVREQLSIALGADDQTQTIDPAAIDWDVRVTHEEWKAIFDDVEKVLAKHDIDETARSTFRSQFAANESVATEDIPRKRTALFARASIGMNCPESSLTSKPLESDDSRAMIGCGKGAIYDYVTDPNTAMSKWTLEAPATTPVP